MAIISTGLGGMTIPPVAGYSGPYAEVIDSYGETGFFWIQLDTAVTVTGDGSEIELQVGPMSAPSYVPWSSIDLSEVPYISMQYPSNGLTGGYRIKSSPQSFSPPIRPQTYTPETARIFPLRAFLNRVNNTVDVLIAGHVVAGSTGEDIYIEIWDEFGDAFYYPTGCSGVTYDGPFCTATLTGWAAGLASVEYADSCIMQFAPSMSVIVPAAQYILWDDTEPYNRSLEEMP